MDMSARPTSSDTAWHGPLTGVKVVSLCQAIAGPFACSMLGDLGADVIGIENPNGRDASRPGAHNPGWGTLMDRRNSRSLCMNIKSSEGKSLLAKLLSSSDMLIEGFRGGQLAKWGLSDQELWKINPALVIVHISGFGQTGLSSYVQRASFDGIGQAYSGFLEMNGFSDRPPLPAFPQVSDYYAGFMALTGGLAALHHAKKTGEGDSIDVAQFEAMLRCSGYYIMDYLNTKTLPARGVTFNAGMGTYICRDGVSLYVMVLGSGVLKHACAILDLPYGSDLFPNGISGVRKDTEAGEALEAALANYLQTHDAETVEQEFLASGIPCSRVYTFAMGEADPHYQARKTFTEWQNAYDDHSIRGVSVVPRLKKHPGKVRRGMPLVGQHNEEILKSMGLSSRENSCLYKRGILAKESTPQG